MNDRSRAPALKRALALNLDSLDQARGKRRRSPTLATRSPLPVLVADLVAARTAVCMTQADVAARMGTTKSAISRLESGTGTRPTLRTVERYALAVGAFVEIRVRTKALTAHRLRCDEAPIACAILGS